jgi:trigger factor
LKSTVETLSPTRVRLAVEVPFDELKPSLDKAYASIAKQVRVPGFRPGKAPQRIIDQRVGRAAVLDEAVQDAVPRAYSAAVQENDVRVLGQPEIELTKLADGDALAFTAEVDVRPQLTLPAYDGIAVTVEDAEVTDEQVDEQVGGLRERFAVLKAADRAVADGDYVSIDLRATVDGEEVPGGSTTGLTCATGWAGCGRWSRARRPGTTCWRRCSRRPRSRCPSRSSRARWSGDSTTSATSWRVPASTWTPTCPPRGGPGRTSRRRSSATRGAR